MFKTYKVTDRQLEFLPILREWILSHRDDHAWVMGSRVRDRGHFEDVVVKVGILGEYDEIDKQNLEWITTEYYIWKKNPSHYI
jgi:hypothetical protein